MSLPWTLPSSVVLCFVVVVFQIFEFSIELVNVTTPRHNGSPVNRDSLACCLEKLVWCCGGAVVVSRQTQWFGALKKNLCQKFSHEYVGLAFCWLWIKVHSNLIMSTRQCDDQIHWRKSSKLPDSDSCFGHRLPHFIILPGHQALWDSWRLGGHGPCWRTSMSMWLLWNFG